MWETLSSFSTSSFVIVGFLVASSKIFVKRFSLRLKRATLALARKSRILLGVISAVLAGGGVACSGMALAFSGCAVTAGGEFGVVSPFEFCGAVKFVWSATGAVVLGASPVFPMSLCAGVGKISDICKPFCVASFGSALAETGLVESAWFVGLFTIVGSSFI